MDAPADQDLTRFGRHHQARRQVHLVTQDVVGAARLPAIGPGAGRTLADADLRGGQEGQLSRRVDQLQGSGGGALLAGFNRRDSLRLGIGMVSRGEVGLIVASVALSGQVIQRESFSVLVFMIIMATVITPFMLRLAYREADADAIAEADDKSPAQGD